MKELHALEETMLQEGKHHDNNSCADSSNAGSVHELLDSEVSLSTTNKQSTANGETAKSDSESSTLARRETTAVNRTKLAVLFVLGLAAVGVGVATYIFARNTETKDFEERVRTQSSYLFFFPVACGFVNSPTSVYCPLLLQFHDFAIEMEDLIHGEARNVFLTISNFGTTITSEVLASGTKWPFITIPHMEVRGREINVLSNALMVGFSPIVQEEDRDAWEIYTNYQQDAWIKEGVQYSLNNPMFDTVSKGGVPIDDGHRRAKVGVMASTGAVTSVDDLAPIHPYLFRTYGEDRHIVLEEGPGPYLPVWQQSPAPHDTKVVNYNLLDNEVFDRVFHGMNETLHPVLSEATELGWFYEGSIHDDVSHPHSFLLQPVFEDFDKSNRDSSHIKGVAIAILPWDHYYQNILPPDAHGIIVVMEDTCGDVFSYEVNGPDAIFLGYGDFHDPTYEHLVEVTLFAPFELNFSETHSNCKYDLHIYPSQELEEDYRTNKPIFYSVLVVAVFFVTAMVFVLYDYYVQTRQNKVMLAAKKSNAVVASLFPKKVRERMLKDVEAQMEANEKFKGSKIRLGAMPKSELKNFLDDGVANADGVAFDTKPIADLFPNTTVSKSTILAVQLLLFHIVDTHCVFFLLLYFLVVFGDISGFTAWSRYDLYLFIYF